ncbi:acyltransferase family protein [Novosphingobium sp.]|uniref:acyltransferase family protein n=1 Tax=Novosphingobium sp. TaxID=1874826 RepID=UPI003D0DF43A
MRLILCVGVILQHSATTSYGHENGQILPFSLDRYWYTYIVPMFFTLSGFLVSGSLFRCKSLISFLGLRIIRLVPALAVEVFLSAILIGPLLTSFPLKDYVQNKEFAAYFLNILGDIHYVLPGVFTTNPIPRTINDQLWTIPFELISYITLAALTIIKFVQNRKVFFTFCIAVQSALLIFAIAHQPVYARDHILGGLTGYHEVYFFLLGILFYCFRDKIVHSRYLFLASFISSEILLAIPGGNNLLGFPIAYMTTYLGLMNPKKPKLLFSGDFSYGMYLYGFPIQQVVSYALPNHRTWYLNFGLGVLGAFLIAQFSWWCVEKPALSLKGKLIKIEDRILPRLGIFIRKLLMIS